MDQGVSDVAAVERRADDGAYDAFLARLSLRLAERTDNGKVPMFTTDVDAETLYEAYLAAFPAEDRQYHTCRSCQSFISRYAGLVVVQDDGQIVSALWDVDDAHAAYKPSVHKLRTLVEKSRITGVFLSSSTVLGIPRTGTWSHLNLVQPSRSRSLYTGRVLNADQAMAAKREDLKTVFTALDEFTQTHLDQAVALLKSDALFRSEKVLGPVEWLCELKRTHDNEGNRQRARNLVWRAVALAPDGFCHPRSGMAGTLLDDLAAGMAFPEISRRFRAKMDPTQYQRPQAPPKAGAIDAAEKTVAALGIERSLARRFARLDEIETVWREPADAPPPTKKSGGVFASLREQQPGPAKAVAGTPPIPMTWEKFSRTILPTVTKIDAVLPPKGPYTAMVTAVHADAPPILQWDREDRRNPVSWYLWVGGSTPSQFGLVAHKATPVLGISLRSHLWHQNDRNEHEPLKHHGTGLMLVLQGARDTRNAGSALFPETLRSELHGVRSVIEAYSKKNDLTGGDDPAQLAQGISLCGTRWPEIVLRVRQAAGSPPVDYVLDRWD